jgi:PTS system galactitol-specific IIA component
MAGSLVLTSELVAIGLDAVDARQAIRALTALLEQGGHVKDSFADAVLERESTFPTGLPTGEIAVAIPHADSVHVLRSAMAVGVLAHPVKFQEMGDPETALDVDVVMVLAIQDPKAVVPFLQRVCTILQDQDLLARLKASTEARQVIEVLRSRLDS